MSVKGSMGRVERFSSALASLRSRASTGSLKNLVMNFLFGLNWAGWSGLGGLGGLGGQGPRRGERERTRAPPPTSPRLMEPSHAHQPWGQHTLSITAEQPQTCKQFDLG